MINGEAYGVEWSGTLRRLRYPGGGLYAEGHWIDGKREGEHRVWYESGQLQHVATYEDDLRQGWAKSHHRNGRVSQTGRYLDGYRHGDWQAWYESGSPKSQGSYVRRQVREGPWLFWNIRGELTEKSGIYQNGDLVRGL